MRIQESAENYLEVILILSKRLGKVRSVDVAAETGFSKPSVSVAMKRLRENGYIDMDAEGFLTLLPPGDEIAAKMYERHCMLADMLAAMGVSPETALVDACKIEHVVSEESFSRMKEFFEGMKRQKN